MYSGSVTVQELADVLDAYLDSETIASVYEDLGIEAPLQTWSFKVILSANSFQESLPVNITLENLTEEIADVLFGFSDGDSLFGEASRRTGLPQSDVAVSIDDVDFGLEFRGAVKTAAKKAPTRKRTTK